MSTQFGLDESSRLVHVSVAARGLACACRCVVCEEPLIARKGEVREHHFAHASSKEPCDASHESLLHRYAKQVIGDSGGLVVPASAPALAALGQEGEAGEPTFVRCPVIQAEQPVGALRVDLLAVTEHGAMFAIEVAYSSFCDLDKRAQLTELALPTLEIDLRLFTPAGFDPDEVADAVVKRPEGKEWIHPCEPQPAPVSFPPPLPSPSAAPAIPAEPAPPTKAHLPEQIYVIAGRWVRVRQFPNGDIAVGVVQYDPDLVSLVKTICKEHHGRYNAKYKTWNVPRWRAEAVRAALRDAEQTVQIGVVAVGPSGA